MANTKMAQAPDESAANSPARLEDASREAPYPTPFPGLVRVRLGSRHPEDVYGRAPTKKPKAEEEMDVST